MLMDTKSKHKIHCATRASVQPLRKINIVQSRTAPAKGFRFCSTAQKIVAHCAVKTLVNSGSPLRRNSLIYKAGLRTQQPAEYNEYPERKNQ